MEESSDTNDTDHDLDVSWYPTSVEELHELLTFYRKQTIVFKNERKEYENILSSLKMSNQEKHKLEWELHNKSESNEELKRQLSDTHILLYKEKNSNISLESDIKSSNAQINELKNDKEHLLQLLQSSNNNICSQCNQDKENRKHKRCKACNYNKQQHIITKPQKLTTIYLPNKSAETIQIQLNAKEEELQNLKEQFIKINEYLINDRNKTNETLQTLQNEYDTKFKRLQEETVEISKQHMFNLKQYLHYRRDTKQQIEDLQMNLLRIRHENNKMKNKCNNKIKNVLHCTNKAEKEIKKESNKLINGFRMETMKKHEELKNVKDELKTLTKSYQFDMKNIKNKLNKSKKKNKKLNQINKCQKIGVQTDVENLKKRLNKLQQGFNNLCVDEKTNNPYYNSLQKEIDKITNKLLELAKITEE